MGQRCGGGEDDGGGDEASDKGGVAIWLTAAGQVSGEDYNCMDRAGEQSMSLQVEIGRHHRLLIPLPRSASVLTDVEALAGCLDRHDLLGEPGRQHYIRRYRDCRRQYLRRKIRVDLHAGPRSGPVRVTDGGSMRRCLSAIVPAARRGQEAPPR